MSEQGYDEYMAQQAEYDGMAQEAEMAASAEGEAMAANYQEGLDNYTASQDKQLNKLANFIMDEIDGEPSEHALENEDAVDTAIRIMFAMKDQNIKLKSACKLLCETPPVGAAYAIACQEAVTVLRELGEVE